MFDDTHDFATAVSDVSKIRAPSSRRKSKPCSTGIFEELTLLEKMSPVNCAPSEHHGHFRSSASHARESQCIDGLLQQWFETVECGLPSYRNDYMLEITVSGVSNQIM